MPAPETSAPQALEAERAILAALMLDRALVGRVRTALAPEAFFRTAHGTAFRAILALDDRGERADLVSLAAEMKAAGTLEAAGGPPALAALLDECAAPAASLDQHVRLVRLMAAQRAAIRLGRELDAAAGNGGASATDFSGLLAGYGTRLEEIRRAAEPEARAPDLEAQIKTDVELFAAPAPRADDLVGTGYLVAGGFSILASLPGFGKTFLALQMMRALAAGTDLLGLRTIRARSLMLQLEMPEYSIRERLAAPLGGMTDWLIMPEGFAHLEERATLDALCRAIEQREVRFAALDPLHALHGGNVNFDDELAPFLNAIRTLRRRTGVHVMLLHHVNKLEFDKYASLRTNVLRSIKGSGRLVSDPDTILGLVERAGRTMLVNAKTRLGPSPEAVALEQDKTTGWFAVTNTPEQLSNDNDLKVEKCLLFHGAQGASLDDIVTETKMTRPTARRHLEAIGAVRLQEGERRQRARFFHPSSAPARQEIPF